MGSTWVAPMTGAASAKMARFAKAQVADATPWIAIARRTFGRWSGKRAASRSAIGVRAAQTAAQTSQMTLARAQASGSPRTCAPNQACPAKSIATSVHAARTATPRRLIPDSFSHRSRPFVLFPAEMCHRPRCLQAPTPLPVWAAYICFIRPSESRCRTR